MIKLQKVSYRVLDNETGKERYILKDLSVELPKNKVTVITGFNGSGKSTLIKLIMGVIKPTSGKIFYNDTDITDMTIDQRANMGLTIAFQQPIRFKGLTVKDLLDTASHNQTKLNHACEYLSKVGLCAKDYVDRELDGTLSGGELKRIELAMALAKGGNVMLFDEPEAGIDLWSFDSLVNLFKDLNDRTVIIVSHQKKILNSADYILLLNSVNGAKLDTRENMIDTLHEEPKCSRLGGNDNE